VDRVSTLSARDEQILCSIVRAFIDSGEPVASATVSRQRRHGLGPASIRNVMSELATTGYLSQPHTSAGRVPTEKAFQVYVRGLQGKRLHHDKVGEIRGKLSDAASVGIRAERCSHMLTEMTDSVGIAAAIPSAAQTLDCVELIALDQQRVLMVLVTADKIVRNRVVSLDEPVPQVELTTIRNYINMNFGGWLIGDVREELRQRVKQESANYGAILRRLIVLYDKGLLSAGLEPELYMEGTSNLLSFDLHVTRERLRGMLRALEEKKRILQLLDRFLENSNGVGVKVGLGEEDPSLEKLSLIGLVVNLKGGMTAKVAVLGPMRMNYDRAVSAVLHVGRALGSLPT
jgi:heat-inducible transcriptional repressor